MTSTTSFSFLTMTAAPAGNSASSNPNNTPSLSQPSSSSSSSSDDTNTCGAKLYDIPTTDAACAVPVTPSSSSPNVNGNPDYATYMSRCCSSAPVHSYYNDCGLYCLAQGQSVGDLVNCLTGAGVGYADVFCNTNMTATATGAETDDQPSETGTGFRVSSTAEGEESGAAATVAGKKGSISKMGWGVMMLAISSAVGMMGTW